MDLDRLFGRTVLIRLTEDNDGFVSTVRYGPLFRKSSKWTTESPEEADWGAIVDETSYSEE